MVDAEPASVLRSDLDFDAASARPPCWGDGTKAGSRKQGKCPPHADSSSCGGKGPLHDQPANGRALKAAAIVFAIDPGQSNLIALVRRAILPHVQYSSMIPAICRRAYIVIGSGDRASRTSLGWPPIPRIRIS